MKTAYNATLALLAGAALFVFAGCASSGGEKSDSNKNEGQPNEKGNQIYFEGLTMLSQNSAQSDRCLRLIPEMKGKTWKTLVRHANGCVKAGDWRSLDLVAQEIARVEINSPWGAYFLSLAAENLNDLPRAMWMIDLALKKVPDAGIFRYQKGRVLWRMKSFGEAVAEVEAALKREQGLLDAHFFLARLYHRDLNLALAKPHYEQVLAVEPRHRVALEGLGDIMVAQGKNERAVELYTECASVAPNDFHLRIKLAQGLEANPVNQELALANYRAAHDLLARAKGEKIDFDLNDKIKTLEAKVLESKAGKTAKLDEAQSGSPKRAPVSTGPQRRTK